MYFHDKRMNDWPLIGITGTVPVEILYAARLRPVDLNNLFITSSSAKELVTKAESAGFSHNICSWIKGIYSTVISHRIERVLAVTGGDCSNTIALGEVLSWRGVQVMTFEYPLSREKQALFREMERLRRILETTWPEIEAVKTRLDRIRDKLRRLDELTYGENLITSLENHLFLVNSSDFGGDPDRFERDLDQFLEDALHRRAWEGEIRLGYLGVPPIFGSFYETIESLGARVIFNEVQRQFSMPFPTQDIVEQYLQYTYPYGIDGRLKDIREAIEERSLHGLIHYTQTFCHRQIYDILLREALPVPILTLEGDGPGVIDGRTALRLETFIEMLRGQQGLEW